MIQRPSTNGESGAIVRGADGRFVEGNPGGPGSPYIQRVAEWRSAMAKAITPDDIERVVLKLVEAATAGHPWAVRAILDHCVGSLIETQMQELISELRVEAGLE